MDKIEIQYKIQGKTLPSDHGYSMGGGLKKLALNSSDKELKKCLLTDDRELSSEMLLCTISGVPVRKGMIYLNQNSQLRLRCPNSQRQSWYRLLQNQVLDIQGHLIRLTQPRLVLIKPQNRLSARLVTFKLEKWNAHEAPSRFLKSAKKALEKLDIQGEIFIDNNCDGDLALRSLRVKGKHILGFGVTVEGLNETDSIKLQGLGLGGRKHFGCGWFYAPKEEENGI